MDLDEKQLNVVGSNEYIEVAGIKDVPAKIDTGADTSSIWASNIDMEEDGTLLFSLFDVGSEYYTGEKIKTKDYRIKIIRSSHGDEQIRYRVKLPVVLSGQIFETTFTLANRSRNNFPVLIGRHTLENRFLVDVSKSNIQHKTHQGTPHLNRKMQEDPIAFHRKYFSQKGEQ